VDQLPGVAALACFVALALGGCENEMGRTQDGRVATLELDATYPEPFSYLSRVRELSDGTILAADPIGQVLLRLDLDAGTADTIGRQGAGPQEYEGPDEVFSLPGDSTLLIDLGNGRHTVIDPEGTFVAWTPRTTKNESAPGGIRTVHPQFVDTAGNIYLTAPYWLEGSPDSFAIHRIDRVSGIETPVARGWVPAAARFRPGGKRPMLVPHDAWAVGADGRVTVVRANGYSVDWYLTDGSMIHGAPNDIETFLVGLAEKQAEVESYNANATFTRSWSQGGTIQRMQVSRGMPPGTELDVDEFEWPEMMPVFSRVLVSPRGEAWVERYMPAAGPGRVDVFDNGGIRLGFIELPPQSKVIGFGTGAEPGFDVYLTRTDDVGLIWLERYRVLRVEGRR
jgi:hypothetical protein